MAPAARQRGFSVLELLISVGIVAILLGLLVPALSLAREGARTTVCSSNLRQIGLGWQGYLNDHEAFPAYSDLPEWRYGGARFVGPDKRPLLDEHRPINPYIAGDSDATGRTFAEIFHCPSDFGVTLTSAGVSGASATAGLPVFEYYGSSYRANHFLLDAQAVDPFRDAGPLAVAEVHVPPSSLLIAGDAQWHIALSKQAMDASWHKRPSAGNMLAQDGSVRFTTFTAEPRGYTVYPFPEKPPAR
ncbi:MAG: DUF1559 domain-containing protein [Phycisphaerales bacterium JB039]